MKYRDLLPTLREPQQGMLEKITDWNWAEERKNRLATYIQELIDDGGWHWFCTNSLRKWNEWEIDPRVDQSEGPVHILPFVNALYDDFLIWEADTYVQQPD